MSRRIGAIGRCAAAALVALAAPASAVTCTVTPQPVRFGTYDTLSSVPLDGVGTIRLSCDLPVGVGVALSGGGPGEGRWMNGAAAQLRYNLYTDPARTIVWGEGVSVTGSVTLGKSIDLNV